MKIPYFLILTACASVTNVYAEAAKLPPVLDNSTYSDVTPGAASALPTPSYEEANDLEQLKTDISALKSKLRDQDETINYLKRSNDELHKKLTDAPKQSSTTVSKSSEPTKTPAKDLTVAETDKERYQHASALLKKADYTQAIAEFQGIIKTYPSSKYADNSQYWIAVSLLNKGDKKGAIQAFDRVARNYPKSDKAPEALYKLGSVLLSLNNKAKAKEYFDYVIQNYPGTNGAALSAKKKAQLK